MGDGFFDAVYSTGSEFCFKNLVIWRWSLCLQQVYLQHSSFHRHRCSVYSCITCQHIYDAYICVMLQNNDTKLDAVRQQRCSSPTEWLNFGGFVLHESQVSPAGDVSALCVRLAVSTKALANVLLTWGFLQSLCIEGCSCAGSASVVAVKMCIHRWASREEQWIQKCSLRKLNMFFFSCWDIHFSKQDVTWWSYPKQSWGLLLFIFPQKNTELWGHPCAAHLLSYFLLVLFVFSFPQESCPHLL